MAHQTGSAPTIIMSQNGNRQQVPLRDYLNTRIAPFLKKAMTESLDVEAEFPLQWLGECLINQSILYEGNPDRTNIKERFLYKFDQPAAAQTAASPMQTLPQEHSQDESSTVPVTNGIVVASTTESESQQPPSVQTTLLPNGAVERIDEERTTNSQPSTQQHQQDTEMEGTS